MKLIILFCFVRISYILATNRQFPVGFKFGVSTSAYQVEGAWNVDGKSMNIWDNFTHTNPNRIRDASNGDVAANSYYLYKRDIEMLRELGVDFYRFSLSWTRILPTGFPDKINPAGVEYYNNLINELLMYNIEPVVTIYHWDLPQTLQDMGGWQNPNIIQWYGDFARTVFELFGDRVKYWITINEPSQVCFYSYEIGMLAPGISSSPGISNYLCAKNLLLAHATAYHIYDEEFRPHQNGVIFITINVQGFTNIFEGQTETVNDAYQFESGIYTYPIYSKTGDFPSVLKSRVAAKSAAQGFYRSRLPLLSKKEIKFIQGTSDYFGLNFYTTLLVHRDQSTENYYSSPSVLNDLGARVFNSMESNIVNATMVNMKLHCLEIEQSFRPGGFYNVLKMLREEYGNPPIFVTESGFTSSNTLDGDRIKKLKAYMSALLDAVDSGSDIRAYTFWSLMDNFDWAAGYENRFGLYQVDFGSPSKTRTPRQTAFFYKDTVREHALNDYWKPDLNRSMTIDDGH